MENITDLDLAIAIVRGAILDVETGMRIHGEREGDMDCIRVLGSVRNELVQLKVDLYERV
jgi:hypothetical protein